MRTKHAIKLAAAALIAISAVCCSKKDEEKNDNTAENIAKSYNVMLEMTVNGNAVGEPTATTLKLTAGGNGNSVTIATPATNGMHTDIPAINIPDVAVIKDGDSYMLTKSEYNTSINTNGNTLNYLFANIYGTVSNDRLTLRYELTPGAMPMPISFNYTPQE